MTSEHSSVSVVGLGPMGIALSRALLRGGVATTVWNRTARRAQPLVTEGATAASDLATAVAASDLVIVCLRDHAAVREVLGTLEAAAYRGRVVVNLSSATPGEARETAEWAAARGITYLSGAIMVPTHLIGAPDAVILYSGDDVVFDKVQQRLRLLAGVADYLGADPGQAALYDVAMLEIFFATMTSFLHAAAMVTAQGVPATTFLPYAKQMAALGGDSFATLAANVDAGDHDGTEDNLAMELATLDHIVDTSDEVGLDGGLGRHMQQLAQRAVRAGYGADSYSRLIDVLRPAAQPR